MKVPKHDVLEPEIYYEELDENETELYNRVRESIENKKQQQMLSRTKRKKMEREDR